MVAWDPRLQGRAGRGHAGGGGGRSRSRSHLSSRSYEDVVGDLPPDRLRSPGLPVVDHGGAWGPRVLASTLWVVTKWPTFNTLNLT